MKVRAVMLCLEGDVLQWHQHYSTSVGGMPNLTWEEYLKEMKERFAGE